VKVDVVTEREKDCVPAVVETRTRTYKRAQRGYAPLCVRCAGLHTHANVQIVSLQTESQKLLVLSEAAFIAHITFSKIEIIKERKR